MRPFARYCWWSAGKKSHVHVLDSHERAFMRIVHEICAHEWLHIPVAKTVLGWPKICKLAHVFLADCSYKRLKLAQLLAQSDTRHTALYIPFVILHTKCTCIWNGNPVGW